jgi:pSer/pThr/pTyr-binding forkhead associated (FHA) protein
VQARLVVYRNGKQELCVPIGEAGAGIGRDSCNAVQLAMPEVSKQHAFVQFGDDGWRIRDLNSRNGLLVNGHKVQTAILKDGDRLSVGPYVLVFEIENAQHTYKPVMEIDVSDNAAQQTMPARRSKS